MHSRRSCLQQKNIQKQQVKLYNKQPHFIDTSVIVEILLNQPHKKACLDYLHQANSGNRICITSNAAVGEILTTLFLKKDIPSSEVTKVLEALVELMSDFFFVTVNREAIEQEREIRQILRLDDMDLLHLATAKSWGAVEFATLDGHFDFNSEEKIGIKIILLRKR